MHAEWIAAGAAVSMVLIQLITGFLLLQIRDNIHTALEQFRTWVQETFETKELADKREELLTQRIRDLK